MRQNLRQVIDFLFSKAGVITCYSGIILAFVLWPFSSSLSFLPYWFCEPFLNAINIAQNIKELGFPTLDGVTATNDFSPLCTGLLILFLFISSYKTPVLFGLVLISLAFGVVANMLLLERLEKRLGFQVSQSGRFLVYSVFLSFLLYQASQGLEPILAVTSIFIMALSLLNMLEKPSFKTGLFCGLSVFLAVLVRFDTLLFPVTGIFIFYMQFNGKQPISLKQLLLCLTGFLPALIPTVVWVVCLKMYFETPVPMSLLSLMKAQEIAPWNIFIALVYDPFRFFFKTPTAFVFTACPAILNVLVAYVSIPWYSASRTPKENVFFTLIWQSLFALMFFAFFTSLIGIESFYYPLVVSTPFCLLYGVEKIFARMETDKDRADMSLLYKGTGFILLLFSLMIISRPRSFNYFNPTQYVIDFDIPLGAMNAGQGFAQHTTNRPFLRLDGAGADKQMQTFLDKQTPLLEVLKHYKASHYIAFNVKSDKDCYYIQEPRSNVRNKTMSDWICRKPVEIRQTPSKVSVYLFDLRTLPP